MPTVLTSDRANFDFALATLLSYQITENLLVTSNLSAQYFFMSPFIAGYTVNLQYRIKRFTEYFEHVGNYYANREDESVYYSPNSQLLEDDFLYNLGAGFGFNISDNLMIDAGMNVINLNQALPNFAGTDLDVVQNQINLGLSWRFGGGT
jgi:hypothetical protein